MSSSTPDRRSGPDRAGRLSRSPEGMDVRAALKLGIGLLREAEVPSDTLAAELLLLASTGRTRTSLYSHPEALLSEAESQTYFRLLELRASGMPTQHLTRKQEFWGLEIEVTPDTLIPRPETEHVIEVALDRMALADLRLKHAQNMTGAGLCLADVGTGSGCIALALAKELPAAEIHAFDISPAALAVARRNAERLGFARHIRFLESDMFSALAELQATFQRPSLYDLIVSNPPYIGRREAGTLSGEVRDHEPEIALYGGEEGYELYSGLVAQSAGRLKPGGILVLELGHDSLSAVEPLFDTPEWTKIDVTNDLAGIPRVLSAERRGPA
ncbi:MAG TPA: peptide chain release factor N(5)-glutamine methyltransferase [Candidatus Acidoferrum sp.]|nr:peptide chain release factor N(5)-glutamine methyltransferase [Candidatus Acidoferrum sp.]